MLNMVKNCGYLLLHNTYSAKAYKCVQKSFNKVLFHPRTISRWYQVIDGKSSFTKEAFSLSKTIAQNTLVICNFVIDKLSIHSSIN